MAEVQKYSKEWWIEHIEKYPDQATELRNAVIVRAVEDYREARKTLKYSSSKNLKTRAEKIIVDIYRLFCTKDIHMFTKLNGINLYRAVVRKVNHELEENN